MRDGSEPVDPLLAALGVRVLAAEPGRVTLAARVTAWQLNVGGIAHGGLLSTLLDAASGLAVHSTLPAGRGSPHVQSSYRFVRPARTGAELTCSGEALHASRTLAVARAELRDDRDRLVALGETTHALIDLRDTAS